MSSQTIDESAIRSVIEEVIARLHTNQAQPHIDAPNFSQAPDDYGVFSSVHAAVIAAKDAFVQFQSCSMEQRKSAIDRIRHICISQAEELGNMEMDETRIGRREHKVEKLITAGTKSMGVEHLQSELSSSSLGVCMTEHAPFGVIGAITPVTHSLPTLANNAISMLAGGNSIVFNAHPSGANVARTGVELFNRAIEQEIGIRNLLTLAHPPTIQSAQELFDHQDVSLLVVTGGPAVARAALQSKKRAIVAGPGNPPVVVDETACMDNAARSIIYGASYDNNLLCIAEKEIFVVHKVFDRFMYAMSSRNAFRLNDSQTRALEEAVFKSSPSGKTIVNKEFVGQSPTFLGKAIGMTIPEQVEVLFGETGENSPFVSIEQMTTFLPVVRTSNVRDAIGLAEKYEHGYRHTAIIHSRNLDAITEMGKRLNTTLFVANGPSTASLGGQGEGAMSFSIATPTGEGVTTPLTFTRQRKLSVAGSLRII